MEELDNSRIENFLNHTSSFYYIYDVSQKTFDFIDEKITQVLGYDKEEFTIETLMSLMNKENLQYFTNHELEIVKFLKKIKYVNYQDYIFRYDLNFKTKSNIEKLILSEVSFLEIDETTKEIKKIIVQQKDITGIKASKLSKLSIISLVEDNLILDVQIQNDNSVLTKREIEIVNLLALNYSSAEIAKELFLSIHTVNTHRKNILSKTNCNSVLELILLAKENNWIN